MPTKKLNPFLADCQLSLFSNTTHVGLSKLLFKRDALHYIQKAIEDIFKQIKTTRKAGLKPGNFSSEIPYTIFPEVKKALEKYNKKSNCDFLVLYFKHSPIGVIKEALPVSVPVCKECGIMVKKHEIKPVYTLWERIVRLFFRGAFEKPTLSEFRCQTHGVVDDPPYIVM
jgi:hypothetical protein